MSKPSVTETGYIADSSGPNMDSESMVDHEVQVSRSAPPPSGTLNRVGDAEDSLSIRASRTGEFVAPRDNGAILKWAALGLVGFAGVTMLLAGLTFAAQTLLKKPEPQAVVEEPAADGERTVDGIKVRKGLRQ